MRIAIYGLPCSGKTTLMNEIKGAKVVNGAVELDRIANGNFANLSDAEKNRVRVEYTQYIHSLSDELIVSDGHYSFIDDVVFTPNDGDLYDVFFYLYCSPDIVCERLSKSEKNDRFSDLSIEILSRWQTFEIESLRRECHSRNKDFYVISDNTTHSMFNRFLSYVVDGFSVFKQSQSIVDRILKCYPNSSELWLVDGDKTIIRQDTYRCCCNGNTKVFDGNHYSGYQSFLFKNELTGENTYDNLDLIEINECVHQKIIDKDYVILSSGITDLWDEIRIKMELKCVIADVMISSDTKYYVAKILKGMGIKVYAIGDSKIDLYMLKEADEGYLYIGTRLSRSLYGTNIGDIKLLYQSDLFCLSQDATSSELKEIAMCKSSSGVNGYRLARSHFDLGCSIGNRIRQSIPSVNTAVLVIERGGRFFGDGIYCSFGGVFYSYNPSIVMLPEITQNRVLIVDSVINTGKSILCIVDELMTLNPNIEVFVAANVIQQDAIRLLKAYKMFVVRISSNSFVGMNQEKQIGKIGPDTADRLFNRINDRFDLH